MGFVQIISMAIVMVILPIVPAYFLYRHLPNKTVVKGPFKGLNIHLGGAFGGYFLILLMISGFFWACLSRIESYETWTIEGAIKLNDHVSNIEDTRILVKPPNQELYPDGRFFIKNMLLQKKEGNGKPSLIIQKEGYNPESLILSESPASLKGFTDYGIKYLKNDKIIRIEIPIILERASRKYEYKADGNNEAKPIGKEDRQ